MSKTPPAVHRKRPPGMCLLYGLFDADDNVVGGGKICPWDEDNVSVPDGGMLRLYFPNGQVITFGTSEWGDVRLEDPRPHWIEREV
jgi:hypothetical protein